MPLWKLLRLVLYFFIRIKNLLQMNFFIVSVCFVRVTQEFFFLVFISIHVSTTKATLTVKYFLIIINNYYINIIIFERDYVKVLIHSAI